jgi:hypothetical protein
MAQVSTNRLLQYAALAAAVPAAGAQAGIVAQTGLNLVINPGESALIDFGAGFGEVFRFELRSQRPGYSSDARSVEAPDYYAGLFQFNAGNGNGISGGGFINNLGSSGGSGGNDPARLGPGSAVSFDRNFYAPMTTGFGTIHDLAFQDSSTSAPARNTYGYGSWFPDARGFVGFQMFKDGSFHFGWFDVETVGWATPSRNGVSPLLIIHGWGFNDEPRAAIGTGDVPAPAAGGLLALALGAAGIRRARRIDD